MSLKSSLAAVLFASSKPVVKAILEPKGTRAVEGFAVNPLILSGLARS